VVEGAEALYALFGLPFRILYCGRNLGFAGACNLGTREATGQLLLLLNSDVLPLADGWLGRLRSMLTAEVGAVGGRLLYEDGSIQHAGMVNESYQPWGGLEIGTHPGKGFPERLLPAWRKNPPAATAACLLMRRSEYLDLGGLSRAFIIGDFEDIDLCRRLRARGRTIRIAQDARLYHLERQSIAGLGDASWRQSLTAYNCWLSNMRAATAQAD
jgi:GT2 family glycosyltransferase